MPVAGTALQRRAVASVATRKSPALFLAAQHRVQPLCLGGHLAMYAVFQIFLIKLIVETHANIVIYHFRMWKVFRNKK